MLFDSHSHIYFDQLVGQEEALLSRMAEHDITHAVQVGCNRKMNNEALELAKKYPNLPATIGLHPTDGQEMNQGEIDHEILDMDLIISENRQFIVGFGEIGLDYFHVKDSEHKTTQKYLFKKQIKLAAKYKLPVIIHSRDSSKDLLEIIKETNLQNFVLHCYSEDFEFAKKILEIAPNACFSFSGMVTYRNAFGVQEAASMLPLDRMLIETDAPFLPPQPVRGQVNEPSNVRYVLDKICELRSEGRERIEKTIYENSMRFYGL